MSPVEIRSKVSFPLGLPVTFQIFRKKIKRRKERNHRRKQRRRRRRRRATEFLIFITVSTPFLTDKRGKNNP